MDDLNYFPFIPELTKLTIFRYDRDIFSLCLLFDGHNRFWQNYFHGKNILSTSEVCRKIFQMQDFVRTLSVLEKGSLLERMTWIARLYDLDGDGNQLTFF